jgi:peptidoglycan/LPS O-acetylase OafA/YrhL
MTPAQARIRRAAGIDGLRAIAALSVVGYHAWLYAMARPSTAHQDSVWAQAAHELRLGLVLFFVLSGYLLFTPWVRSALDGGAAPRLWGYLVRRGARILPAYYLALAGSVVLLWHHDAVPGVRLPDDSLWLFAVFGQNFSESTLLRLDPPMWTLAVEMTFYVVLPVLGWLALRLRGAGRAGQTVVPLLLLVAGVLYNNAIAGADLPDPVTKVLPAMAPYFAVGMLAAVLAHGRAPGRRLVGVMLLAGAALVGADAYWHAAGAAAGSHDLALRIWRDLAAAVGFALIAVAVAHAASPLRALGTRPLAYVGRISFGLYLWHVPLMLWLKAQGLLPRSPLLALAVALPLALAVAALSWRYVERPVQERARRATRPQDGPGRSDAVTVTGRRAAESFG